MPAESGYVKSPGPVIRPIVKTAAEMELPLWEKYLAPGSVAVGQTLGRKKPFGWQQGEVVEPTRETDVHRKDRTIERPVKKTGPLRDTGVHTSRNGNRMFVHLNGLIRDPIQRIEILWFSKNSAYSSAFIKKVSLVEVDLSGEWEIQEEDKTYRATLNAQGNGSYTWQEGHIQTKQLINRLWSGTWQQKGNDREGGFEVLLSEDGNTAEGVWWYARVGTQKNIPPREWGGTYKLTRLSASTIP